MRGPSLLFLVLVALAVPGPFGAVSEASASACDVRLSAGAGIQEAIDHHSEGAIICLSGWFVIRATIRPKPGNVLRGDADLVAAPGVTQAIDAAKSTGVHIIGLTIHGFSERAFKCGPRSVVRDVYFHHNGRNGMGGGGCNRMLVEQSEFAYNGNVGEIGSGSGGIKIAGSFGVVIRGNDVHDNVGVGIWCDEDCHNLLVARNRAVNNTRKGIFFEKGNTAVIRYNLSRRNNSSGQAVGGGIGTVSSIHVRIYGNSLGGNAEHGIKVWDDSRGYVLDDIRIHDNDLAYDPLTGCAENGAVCWGNLRVGT